MINVIFYKNTHRYICFIILAGMSVIYVLLSISIAVAVLFLIAFLFSVKSGQYDDSYTPSVRMLFEDELVAEPSEELKSTDQENKLNNEQNL